MGEVDVAGSSVAECLVGSDGVVELAEAIDLDGEHVAVADGGAVEVFIFQGAEEPFDDAVGLRALDAGPDVAQQRIVPVEGDRERRPAKAWALSVTTAIAAGARVHLAEELVERLPATLAALQRGEIDLPKARAVVDAVAPLDAQTAAAVEARVLARAAAQTVGQLRAALARAVLTVDPDGVEQRHRAARAERRVELGPERDGMAWLGALLPAHEAIACYTRLDTLARSMPDDDPRGMDARRADASVSDGLCTGGA